VHAAERAHDRPFQRSSVISHTTASGRLPLAHTRGGETATVELVLAMPADCSM